MSKVSSPWFKWESVTAGTKAKADILSVWFLPSIYLETDISEAQNTS